VALGEALRGLPPDADPAVVEQAAAVLRSFGWDRAAAPDADHPVDRADPAPAVTGPSAGSGAAPPDEG